mmetsp:Transcript_15488/g.54285  ORF Transcript_15488/g.54285 Transcript_15488/m.54285 type:complete len:81 (+) Transcript_15488:1195-1437(+)
MPWRAKDRSIAKRCQRLKSGKEVTRPSVGSEDAVDELEPPLPRRCCRGEHHPQQAEPLTPIGKQKGKRGLDPNLSTANAA